MKILVTDNCPISALFMEEFMKDSGHTVKTTANAPSPELLKEKDFDFTFGNLNEFVKEIESLKDTTEKVERFITKLITDFLKNLRLKKHCSPVQLGNTLVAMKKSGNLECDTCFKKSPAKIVRLFESGDFCPPYDYMDAIAQTFSAEEDFEQVLRFIEKNGANSKDEIMSRAGTILLLNIYYKKNADKVEKIINSSVSGDNLLDFCQYKNFKFREEG